MGSREFEFRAWDSKSKFMRYDVGELHFLQGGLKVLGACHYIGNGWVRDNPLMQMAPFTDFYKKKLYEEDYVELDQTDIGGSVVRGKIIFNMDNTLSNFEWGLQTKEGYVKTDFLGKITHLGNSYENPDLLT